MTERPPPPIALTVQPDAVPQPLKDRAQWVVWRYFWKEALQKYDKPPLNPHNGNQAKSNAASTWSTFDRAMAAYAMGGYDGVGFVPRRGDHLVMIDLDKCRDPTTGAVAAWAQQIVDALQTYTEISPSGTGLHLIAAGKKPTGRCRQGGVEIYDGQQYLTVTGNRLPGTPATIEPRQAAIDALCEETFRERPSTAGRAQSSTNGYGSGQDDAAVLQKCRTAQNRAKFARLYDDGDLHDYDGDESRADAALCAMLAFYTRDAAQIDRLFRGSRLYRPKWEREDYRDRTIANALGLVTDTWTPGHSPNGHGPQEMPALPDYARVDDALAATASPWLDAYVDWSRKWAPRAYQDFHEAAGLFGLSVVASRRVRIELGPGMYPSLFMALVARTTLFTKSTAADLVIAFLRLAGLGFLLASDDATPQAFIRSLTRRVPDDFDDLCPDDQRRVEHRLRFAAQRGWFYEEWGQHIDAMMQRDGHMASFRSMLRRFDDHKPEYSYETVSRGIERVSKPYLAMLCNATPADLEAHLRRGSKLWRDGFLARFALIAPPPNSHTDDPFPEGAPGCPKPLIAAVSAWHRRLGLPTCNLTPILDKKGQPTGRYRADVGELPETRYALTPEVRGAYYAYDKALRELMSRSTQQDLDGSYGRFPVKALRIAALLSSLHDLDGRHQISLACWYRGQAIAERWRASLHRLVLQVQPEEAPSPERKREDHVSRTLKKHGALSVRDLRYRTGLGTGELLLAIEALIRAGVAQEEKTAHTTKYVLVGHGPQTDETDE